MICHIQENLSKMSSYLEITEARREWTDILKVVKEKMSVKNIPKETKSTFKVIMQVWKTM